MREVLDSLGPADYPHNFIPDLTVTTSPRRFVEYMALRGFNVWDENTFHNNASHRTSSERPDISERRLEELLRHKVYAFPKIMQRRAMLRALVAYDDGLDPGVVHEAITREIDEAADMFSKLIGAAGIARLNEVTAFVTSPESIDAMVLAGAQEATATYRRVVRFRTVAS
jgi:hypothetical protein